MNRLERDIEAWLEAEARGTEAGADEALGRMFRRVERRSPPAGFSRAVLAAAGFVPSAGRAAAPWLRLAVVGCAVSACLVVAAAPWLLIALKTVAHLAVWPLLAALWRAVVASADFALACWAIVGDVATALRLSVATPTGATILFGNLAIASISLLGLKRLLASSRSFSNAS